MTPEELMSAIQQAMDEGLVNQIYQSASVKEGEILDALRERGIDAYNLSDLQRIPTEQLDAQADLYLKSANRTAALTGLTYGAFPLIALVPELMHLLVTVIRSAQRLSLTYGQEIESYRGSLQLWETIGEAFGVDPAKLEGAESELFKNLPVPVRPGAMPLSPIMFRMVQGILLTMAYGFVKHAFRIVPFVGMGVAGAANYQLMRKVGRQMRGDFRGRHELMKMSQGEPSQELSFTLHDNEAAS